MLCLGGRAPSLAWHPEAKCQAPCRLKYSSLCPSVSFPQCSLTAPFSFCDGLGRPVRSAKANRKSKPTRESLKVCLHADMFFPSVCYTASGWAGCCPLVLLLALGKHPSLLLSKAFLPYRACSMSLSLYFCPLFNPHPLSWLAADPLLRAWHVPSFCCG